MFHHQPSANTNKTSTDDWKLEFLLEFENFATFWKKSSVSYGFVQKEIKLLNEYFIICIEWYIKEYFNLSILVPLLSVIASIVGHAIKLIFLYVRLQNYYITMFQISKILFCLYLAVPLLFPLLYF